MLYIQRQELKNVVAEHKKKIAAEERRLGIMYEAVDFLEKMAWYMAELDDILALNKNDRIVESELCESKLAEAIEVFDEEKCMNDEYDGEYE